MASYLVYDAITEDDTPPMQAPRPKTVLESNVERLRRELARTAGRRVAILGQPDAGKSSLLSKLSRNEVEPPPLVGTHTDATNWAADPEASLLCRWQDFVFADVPGYDTVNHPTQVMLDTFPFGSFDAFALVVRGKVRQADQQLHARLQRQSRPVVVVRTFSESLECPERAAVRKDLLQQLGSGSPGDVVFASNRTGEGMQEVLRRISASAGRLDAAMGQRETTP
ncbi:GTPase [uncultured Azohydromonas sp.]|jgi:Predicted GTPase|uniref:GTPase domain-containing protein n=1 Tax=uncultured Azohydromonas sp. TaxID=487342 RepID=UPI0026231B15|nr:GTPase [uncultured Azohydromonas sp.]